MIERLPESLARETQELLSEFCREIEEWKATWGCPTDREVHLNTWARVSKRVRDENKSRVLGTKSPIPCQTISTTKGSIVWNTV